MKSGILAIRVSTISSEMVFLDTQTLQKTMSIFAGASLEETSFSAVHELLVKELSKQTQDFFATEVHLFLNSLTNHPINETNRKNLEKSFPGSIVYLYDESEFVLRCQSTTFEGIVVSLGTTTFCAMKKENAIHVIGQYPQRLVNHGSAYQIGILALTHLAKALDHIYPMTPFLQAIQKAANIEDRLQLKDFMNHAKRIEIAELAKIVTSFAPVNQHAYRILANQADEVQTMVDSFLSASSTPPTTILLHGGLLMAETMYRHLILQNLRRIAPSATIELAKGNLIESFVTRIMMERGTLE